MSGTDVRLSSVQGVQGTSLLLDISDQVAVLSINRPEKRNSLTLELWKCIGRAVTELDGRDDVRVIVLTGTGGSFSAGADISEFGEVRSNPRQVEDYELSVDACCDAIAACVKPTIAAINGFCIGGGMNLAMSCDFRYASETAQLGIPAARLSIVYGIKGTSRLFELVGLAQAKKILFTGQRLSAAEALKIGLVDEVDSDGLNLALRMGQTLSANAPLSISGAKAMLNSLSANAAPLGQEQITALIDQAASSEDYAEGRNAFAEKRKPVFKGI